MSAVCSDVPAPAGEVVLTRAGPIATVTLSHPGRLNALTARMWQQLAHVMNGLHADRALRAVVITGAGTDFAAGADIREFPALRHDLDSVQHYHTGVLKPALHAVRDCPHPVIARIQGACVGGGLEIASVCDLRIADETARLGVPIHRLGFSMAPDEMEGLLALAGHAVALELLLEGQVLSADQALARGLLTRVVPAGTLDDAVERSLRAIQRGAPQAARLSKAIARRLTVSASPLSPQELRDCFAYADSRDHAEGVRAFLAREAPVFTGDDSP